MSPHFFMIRLARAPTATHLVNTVAAMSLGTAAVCPRRLLHTSTPTLYPIPLRLLDTSTKLRLTSPAHRRGYILHTIISSPYGQLRRESKAAARLSGGDEERERARGLKTGLECAAPRRDGPTNGNIGRETRGGVGGGAAMRTKSVRDGGNTDEDGNDPQEAQRRRKHGGHRHPLRPGGEGATAKHNEMPNAAHPDGDSLRLDRTAVRVTVHYTSAASPSSSPALRIARRLRLSGVSINDVSEGPGPWQGQLLP
ncbi:hypothetical protein K438DRAFT_1966486 [Mycena galopus ATCC 62051]|nr:hypothetical protein K438DRAFT_1966486 [Mycena galopus ATCC 62051]